MTHPNVNIDPFEDAKIQDRYPIAEFTSGPLRIEMGASTDYENGLLLGVSDEPKGPDPTFTVRIRNNIGWKGGLKKLNKVTITVPDGIDLVPTPSCEFKEGGIIEFEDRRGREYEEDILEEIRCRFKPKMSALEGPKITTKYFKVKAEYNYIVEKSVRVKIEEVPIEEVSEPEGGEESGEPSTESTEAEIPSELGEPDAKGIYEYAAPLATTSIWYRHLVNGAWEWTPYNPYDDSEPDCWMPVTKIEVSTDCGGMWDGESPIQKNIDIITYLEENKPVPTT
jgi:hypothetical protein